MSGLHGRVESRFCKRKESEYDSFGAGHSSTSISAAQGHECGQSMLQRKRITVSL
jgi:1-deoxy-D-xylulose-5-phosphate synthase